MNLRDMTILNWIKSRLEAGRTRKLILLLLDVVAVSLAIYLALLMYDQTHITIQPRLGCGIIIAIVILIKIPVFILWGIYRISLLHLGLQDAMEILKAVSLSTIIFGAIIAILKAFGVVGINLTLLAGDFLLTLMFVGGLRATKRVYYQLLRRYTNGSARRVLIVGSGSAGELTLRAIFQDKDAGIIPVGMVDDDPNKQGMTVQGVPVLGKRQDIPHLVQELAVHDLLIAMPTAPSSVLRETVQLGRKVGLKRIKVLPALHHLVNGKVTVAELRDIQVEDLLGREPVQIETAEIENFLQNKIVLVTGGAGSIGSELCRQIVAFQPRLLVVLDQDETGLFQLRQELRLHSSSLKFLVAVGDIRDEERIRSIFTRFRPAIIFHSAAYKHVSMMEENPREAIRNNVLGTKIVGEAACHFGAEKFVLISTDKAVNPTCIMGATKRLAEIVVQSLDNNGGSCRFVAVRFGNVLGSRGSVVPIFREQIQRGGPVTITHPEMRRYFMTPSEAALLVLQAGAIGGGGEVFVLDMGDPVAIIDLAREMIQLAGLEPEKDIPIVFTHPYFGEKLFEDILTAEEGTVATQHRRIHIAKTDTATRLGNRLKKALEELETLTDRQCDGQDIVGALCKLVPNYSPSGNDADNPPPWAQDPVLSLGIMDNNER